MNSLLNSINVDGKIHSIKVFKDTNNESYCIMRLKIINSHKGKITDVNLIDCFAYKDCYKKIIKELDKDDLVRISGKLQKRNTKDFTIKVSKIKKLEEIKC